MLPTTILALFLAMPSASPAQAPADGERASLEELLARYRAQRDQLLAGLRTRVDDLLGSLDAAVESGDLGRIQSARKALTDLGPECVPLLFEELDPGTPGEPRDVRRAQEVSTVLRALPTAAISASLLELARTGSAQGKRNALEVLRGTEEPERVGAGLTELYRSSTGELRQHVLATLAHLPGEPSQPFVAALLLDDDQEVRRSALEAVANAGSRAAAPKVLDLLRLGFAAARHVKELIAYYKACPSVFDSDHALAVLRLAREPRVGEPDAVQLIELLGRHKDAWSSDVKRELRDMSGSVSRDVETAALVAQARPPSPDSRARRQLLEPYDQEVERRRDYWGAYRDRGDIKLRIEDYSGAIRDYQDAIKNSRDALRPEASPYLGLARAHARQGKLKDAAMWLERAPLTRTQLLGIARDPDFVELAASRYGKVFGELGQ